MNLGGKNKCGWIQCFRIYKAVW
uniref:Uncharacterized protein n=1 Tax=Arundo donax TaxID=35708 RepID=A0A0A9C0P0_ARUDO